jgi:ribose transport system substrate-binding protein
MFHQSKLVLIAAMAILFGCSKSSDQGQTETDSAGKGIKIAVIPKGSTHSYWKSVQAGALKAGEDLGVVILWQGPQKEDDRQLQIQVVQNFISRRVNAIVLAPLDDKSLVQPVHTAVQKGIPVVIIDSGLSGSDFSSFVATDNFMGGKLCAKLLAEKLGGKGKVALLRYQEGSASTGRREEGFLAGIKEYAPEIEILVDNQYAGATIEKAFQTSQNMLNRFGQINGVFASNESATMGMLRALKTAGKTKTVKFVGFDANKDLINSLKAGEIDGLAVQDPYRMGYEGVKAAVAIVKKQPFEKSVDTGIQIVTKENLDAEEVKSLLNF